MDIVPSTHYRSGRPNTTLFGLRLQEFHGPTSQLFLENGKPVNRELEEGDQEYGFELSALTEAAQFYGSRGSDEV